MSANVQSMGVVVAGGAELKRALARARRRRSIIAFLLSSPVLLFLGVLFLVPIARMAYLSVSNPDIIEFMPRTVTALSDWNGRSLPPESAYAALARDLRIARKNGHFGRIGKRLNEEVPGYFGLIGKTSFQVTRLDAPPSWKKALIRIDPRWGKLPVWRLLKRESSPFTADFFLAAFDLRYNPQGDIVREEAYNRVYVPLFLRTFWMSAVIMLSALLLGYPVAYWLANMPERDANLFMIAVLLPLWTSLLVRITAWIVLLQSHGVINDLLVWGHIVSSQNRPKLIYNEFGTIIVMVQVLLPFMVLPLYSVMRGISPSYTRAAISLGATPARAFWRVYFPLTLPGIGAGGILVFIISIGYYITPALVGGQTGQFISNMIAFNVLEALNWHLAAALGTILTVITLVFYAIYSRIAGTGRINIG